MERQEEQRKISAIKQRIDDLNRAKTHATYHEYRCFFFLEWHLPYSLIFQFYSIISALKKKENILKELSQLDNAQVCLILELFFILTQMNLAKFWCSTRSIGKDQRKFTSTKIQSAMDSRKAECKWWAELPSTTDSSNRGTGGWNGKIGHRAHADVGPTWASALQEALHHAGLLCYQTQALGASDKQRIGITSNSMYI